MIEYNKKIAEDVLKECAAIMSDELEKVYSRYLNIMFSITVKLKTKKQLMKMFKIYHLIF